jgi:hypothetical protein
VHTPQAGKAEKKKKKYMEKGMGKGYTATFASRIKCKGKGYTAISASEGS